MSWVTRHSSRVTSLCQPVMGCKLLELFGEMPHGNKWSDPGTCSIWQRPLTALALTHSTGWGGTERLGASPQLSLMSDKDGHSHKDREKRVPSPCRPNPSWSVHKQSFLGFQESMVGRKTQV